MGKTKMFVKLVERCIDCPECGNRQCPPDGDEYREPFCIQTNRDLKSGNIDDYKIPKWCPLQNAPSEYKGITNGRK